LSTRAHLTLATLLVAAVAPACQDGTGPGTGFVVTGHIQNNTQAPIPVGTRLIAIWGVSSGTPDYGYVFGEGTINRATGTFRIRFDQPPPTAALNAGALGVAFLLATTDQSLKEEDVITGSSGMTHFIGITAQHAVIFVASHQDVVQLPDWAAAFDTGYAVGVGAKVPGEVFDKFLPASPSSTLLIVDDAANIHVVNWT
jgi:hypothetical protein